ncbi:hypothetical protein JTB14_037249 [Gonioctena quinquepunctata]|nr:hypothetical protein JTB14_037249 [Gonioctena quinquepunctata]
MKCTSVDAHHFDNIDIRENSSFRLTGGERDVFDIARQCIASTAKTNELLLRQKPKDLPHFSGELTDWLNFIGEFKRSTGQFHISDGKNLIRLIEPTEKKLNKF